MKLLRNNHITSAVAAAALAGFSIGNAFADPTYDPPANTPLDASAITAANSASRILGNFNDFLAAIEAELTGGTLATAGPAPTDDDFLAAVSAAIAADTANAYGIVQAGVAYKPKLIKSIVEAAVTLNPDQAEDIVGAAALVVPKKAADAASSAILGLIAAGGHNDDFADTADDAVLDQTLSVVEKIAKGATKSVKKAVPEPAEQARAEEIAGAIITALLNAGGVADHYLSAAASGAVSGVGKFTGTTKAEVAGAMIDAFAAGPSATSKENAARLVAGALKSTDFASGEVAAVTAVLDAKLTALNPLWADTTNAASDVMARIKQTGLGPITQADFQALLTASYAAEVHAFVLGASVQAGALAPSFTEWALTDGDAIAGDAYKGAVIAGAVSGKFSGAGKVVDAAITAGGVSATVAIGAAIPAALDLQAGKIVSAAYKAAAPASVVDSQAYLSAAIAAAVGAGYQRALPEIASTAAKKDKGNASALVATAIADVPNGWEEGVAAAIVAGNTSAEAAADLAAVGKAGADAASVDLATTVAANGKANKKSLFDDALTALIGNPDKARAVLFGAGSVNGKLAGALLGASLRLKGAGSDTDSVLLNYAIALNKKAETGTRLAYQTAVDAIAFPDSIFDLVDHSTLINPKNAVDIVTGAVSARPEFAHYVARAAGARASKLAGKIGTAAIQFAHMKVVENDNASAVAAISAGLISGVLDANLGAKEAAAIRSAVGGLIKGTLSFPTPDKTGLTGPAFPESDGGVGTTVSVPGKGTAGVVTGAVAQTQGPGSAAADFSALSTAVVTTAVKKAKTHALAIAQAASQAAYFVAQLEGATFGDAADVAAIAAAVLAGGPKGASATQISNAISTGLAQAALAIAGVGAAGLTNTATAYQHHSGMNNPVTSLVNF